MTHYYGMDANNKLLWVNQDLDRRLDIRNEGETYSLYTYDACGRVTSQERHYTGGLRLVSVDEDFLRFDGLELLRLSR